MSLRIALNPFVATSDPRRYLPHAATEAAIAAAAAAVRDGALATCIAGAPGSGKSIALRVLGQRLRSELRVIVVPPIGLGAADLCAWVLSELRAPAADDPETALLVAAAEWRRRGSALAIGVDDVDGLAPETAGRLGALALAAEGGVRWIATASSAPPALLQALGAAAPIPIAGGMSFAETGELVRAALAVACAQPEIRAFFDAGTLLRLHRQSDGNPGEVARLAAEALSTAVASGALPEPGRTAWRAVRPTGARRGLAGGPPR